MVLESTAPPFSIGGHMVEEDDEPTNLYTMPSSPPVVDQETKIKNEQEAEAALIALVRAQVGEDNYNANPCLQRFTRALGNLSSEGRTRVGAMMAIVDARLLSEMHMPQEVWVQFIRSALTTSAWAVRIELLEAMASDVAKGETIDKKYIDETLRLTKQSCVESMAELNHYIMGIAGCPIEWSVRANH